jgi:hypothetical protein
MATPGQLVECIATALDLPKPTVALYDRLLSESGYRSKAGRGRGSAHVTAEDAANLLIAIVGSPPTGPSVLTAVATVEQFAELKCTGGSVGERLAEVTRRLMQEGSEEDGQVATQAVGHPKMKDIPGFGGLRRGHSFREGLTALIESVRDHGLLEKPLDGKSASASVFMRGPRLRANINIRHHIGDAGASYEMRREQKGVRTDLTWQRGFTHWTIQKVADLLSQGASKGSVA